MRIQLARVILAAVLSVASAFAQESGTPNEVLQQQAYQQHGASSGSTWSLSPASLRDRLELPSRFDPRAQDGQDYSVTSLFREAHGEFMDRRERYDPAIELGARWLPNQSIKGEPGDFNMLGYDIDAEFPVVAYPDAFVTFGLYHYGRRFHASDLFGSQNNNFPLGNLNADGNWGDETLKAAGVRLGVGMFLTDYVLLELETSPGVYSDLERRLKKKDFDAPTSALVTVQATENFFFKFGVRYNQIYQDAPWLPWLGFSYEISDGVRLDVMLPEYVELAWWPSASTAFAWGAQVQGAQYSVGNSAGGVSQRDDLNVQEVSTYLGITQRFTDAFSLRARAGAILAGHYDLTTGSQNFDRASGALDQGFFASVMFGIDW